MPNTLPNPPIVPAPAIDATPNIIAWARWSVVNHKQCHYTEGAQRMSEIGLPGHLPFYADCSAAVTVWHNWAGAPDPNGQNYNHTGYTGTLLAHNQHIAPSQVKPGDVVIYGPGTGWHAALVVETNSNGDILTISMGQEGDPSYVWVNNPKGPKNGYPVDGRLPQIFLRTDRRQIYPAHTPPIAVTPAH